MISLQDISRAELEDVAKTLIRRERARRAEPFDKELFVGAEAFNKDINVMPDDFSCRKYDELNALQEQGIDVKAVADIVWDNPLAYQLGILVGSAVKVDNGMDDDSKRVEEIIQNAVI